MLVLRPDSASKVIFEAVRRGTIVFRRDRPFNGVKVFSADDAHDALVERATAWVEQHPELELVDITVAPSSNGPAAIVITYWEAR